MDSNLIAMLQQEHAGLKEEKDRLEAEVADKQERLLAVSKKLMAVEVLIGTPPPHRAIDLRTASNGKVDQANDITMIDAIEQIAVNSPSPVPKSDLRKQLLEMGYPQGSLQNYFYTVIMRLKKGNKIAVLDDGSVTRPGTSH